MSTFNPRAKKFVHLIFHKGALINDQTSLLEGDNKEARVARFYDMDDVLSKKENITTIALAEKFKMTKEAENPSARIVYGKYYDSNSYGKLRKEWDNFHKNKLRE